MVQVASLRIQIDATQAAQSAAQLRRELDGVAQSSRGVATQTGPVEAGIDRTRQAAVTAGREFDKMGLRLGRVSDLFGSFGRKSLIFLGADVLARAAGFNSLLSAMGEGMDFVGKSLKEMVVGPTSFSQAMEKAANDSIMSLDDLSKKLAAVKAEAMGFGQMVSFGDKGSKSGRLNFGGIDFSQTGSVDKVAGILSSLQANLKSNQRAWDAYNSAVINSQKFGVTPAKPDLKSDTQLFREAQDQLKAIAAEYDAVTMAAGFAQANAEAFWEEAARGRADKAWRANDIFKTSSQRQQMGPSPFGPTPYWEQGGGAKPGSYADSGGANFATSLAGLGTYVAGYTAQLKLAYDAQERLRKSGEEFGNAVGSAFENAVFMTGTLRERLGALFQDITRAAFSQLVTKNISGAIAGMFAADGAAFGPSGVIPFAYGGIVSSPTMFGFGGNKTGLMGEAGPEAVMPLKRGADGKLGVQGGGGVTNVTVNQFISTPSPAAFGKSQRQNLNDAKRAFGG